MSICPKNMEHTMRANADTAKLKIGLIVDTPVVSRYVYELAQWANTQPDLAITHLIIQQLPPRTGTKLYRAIAHIRARGIWHLLASQSFSLIQRIEAVKLKRIASCRQHFETADLRPLVPKALEVAVERSPSGFVYRYSAADIAHIKALGLDVLIRAGSGILRGDILRATPFGILSFHHGDNRFYRGSPAGFWEVFSRDDSTGFTLQQLTDELDGGNVLMRGHFVTKFFYLYNQAELYRKSNGFMMALLAKLAITRHLPPVLPSVPYAQPLYTQPGLWVQARYFAYLLSTGFWNLIEQRLLQRKDRWGVAYAKGNWRTLVMWRAQRIPNPPDRFLADPFVVTHAHQDFCFVEDYDARKSKGVISVYRIDTHGPVYVGEALSEPFHLSFPYIFTFNGQYYLCPETSENRDIRIYECVEFPLKWTLVKTSMTNISAADTMIFEHASRWWMLTNTDTHHVGDHCNELSIFYADHPLTDTWTPHARNPVILDARCARNAGLLTENDALFRVSQRQGFSSYGKASAIQRIVTLTPDAYVEETISTHEPAFFSRISGTHHMHSNGRYCVFDVVEKVRYTR
jgi:hypothetical protein